MSLILRYLEGRKAVPLTASPELKKQLTETQKQLNSILKEWNWSGVHPKSAEEFLNKFRPWVQEKLKFSQEVEAFLTKKGVNSLTEADTKLTNRDLSEEEELAQKELETLRQELKEFLEKHSASSLAEWEQTWQNTEQDYLRRIADQKQELKEKVQEFQASNGELLKRIEELQNRETSELPEDYEDLISERDEAVRKQKETEQDLLATNNRLNLKQQEVSSKEKTIEQLKKEHSQKEVSHQKSLKEKNGLITTQQKELNQLKEKYSKQGKLLDTEQLECKKLEEKVEALEAEIKALKGESK